MMAEKNKCAVKLKLQSSKIKNHSHLLTPPYKNISYHINYIYNKDQIMLVVSTILCMITTWTLSQNVPLYYDGEFVDFMVCRGTDHPTDPYDCTNDDACDEAYAGETCQDLGDGINRCYWTDEDVIQIGSMSLDHGGAEYIDRICTHDGDAECAC